MKKTGLYWFRKDLRLQDNETLKTLCDVCDEVLFVFLFETTANDKMCGPLSLSQNERIGRHRALFTQQSLADIHVNLAKYEQKLHVIEVNTFTEQSVKINGYTAVNSRTDAIIQIAKNIKATHIASEWHSGLNERTEWELLCSTIKQNNDAGLNHTQLISENSGLLYTEESFPFSLINLPNSFSPFRRKVEKFCSVGAASGEIVSIPPLPALNKSMTFPLLSVDDVASSADVSNFYPELKGGETSALGQLHYYLFDSNNITSYKETRNGLDGWDFSSKLSAWLAQGCISPRRIYQTIKHYEAERTANESTYWLYFELLWREFFHWHLMKHNSQLFKLTGVQEKTPTTSLCLQTTQKWIEGNTGYNIVDACMRQLKQSGFMSNRGRQLVASCYVHELNQDWRYGAAYFEHQLIDFDVASNYGNWQYLAGVGADPRGHRQFNLVKQTQIYDPQNKFIERWLG